MLLIETVCFLAGAGAGSPPPSASVLRGAAAVAPYRHGSVTACDRCDLQDVCRVDPESVRYRRFPAKAGAGASAGPE